MKSMLRKILKVMCYILPNKSLIILEKRIKNKYHWAFLESLRLDSYLTKTDFEKIDVSSYPVCYITKGTWEYPLFNMNFLENMLDNIIYCLSKDLRPVVMFKNGEQINLWEQFLEQPYEGMGQLTDQYIKCDILDAFITWPSIPTREDIRKYGKIYKAFVKLNRSTQVYFENEYNNILKGKRAIGVLCRGTDYTGNKPKGLPVQPEIRDVIALVKQKMKELDCPWIYLATEEKRIFEQFEAEFPGQILVNKRHYFDDFYDIKKQGKDATRISWVHFDREHDSYYRSLEYFSSLNLLSKCVALIAGNCGGSRTSLYLNDNKYEFYHLFDLGLY